MTSARPLDACTHARTRRGAAQHNNKREPLLRIRANLRAHMPGGAHGYLTHGCTGRARVSPMRLRACTHMNKRGSAGYSNVYQHFWRVICQRKAYFRDAAPLRCGPSGAGTRMGEGPFRTALSAKLALFLFLSDRETLHMLHVCARKFCNANRRITCALFALRRKEGEGGGGVGDDGLLGAPSLAIAHNKTTYFFRLWYPVRCGWLKLMRRSASNACEEGVCDGQDGCRCRKNNRRTPPDGCGMGVGWWLVGSSSSSAVDAEQSAMRVSGRWRLWCWCSIPGTGSLWCAYVLLSHRMHLHLPAVIVSTRLPRCLFAAIACSVSGCVSVWVCVCMLDAWFLSALRRLVGDWQQNVARHRATISGRTRATAQTRERVALWRVRVLCVYVSMYACTRRVWCM